VLEGHEAVFIVSETIQGSLYFL